MSLTAELARLGATGAVYTGARGITRPASFAAWPDTMRDTGYLSDDGLAEARSEDRKEFIPWQSRSPIRTQITKGTKTLKFTMWESSWTTISLYHGIKADDVTVTGTGADEVVEFAEPDVPAQDLRCFGFDVIDGVYQRRIWVPLGEVTARGDLSYKSDELIAYDVTVTAYPDNGISMYRWFKEGWAPPTGP